MAHARAWTPPRLTFAAPSRRTNRLCASRRAQIVTRSSAPDATRDTAPSEERLPKREWADMTTADFEAMDAASCIAILPVGAVEQHGPHLPVCVDAAINAGVLSRAMDLLPDEVRVLRMPPVPYGKSVEHDDFAGTVSLSAATLQAVWTDIGESVNRAGVKKLILFNSHGGQPQIMDVVARDLRKRLGMLVVTCNWFSFGLPDGLFEENEIKHGIHGGDVETSVMLHLHPELVDMSRAENFVSAGERMEREFRHLTPEGGVGFGWLAQDLNPSGAIGNATMATAEKGELCVEHAAERLVALIEEVDNFNVDCVFNRGEPGRYCQVSLRKVWRDEDEFVEPEPSGFKSHYTGS